MSANEKQVTSVKQKRIQEREAAAKREKALKIKVIVFVVAFVIIAAALLLLTSNWFYQNCTAVEINGMKWSIADYNFHFNNQYTIIRNELAGMLGDEASDKIPERGAPLKKMVFSEETGETWYDYITGLTMDVLTEVTILYQDAIKEGHTLTESQQIAMFNEINSVAMYANYNGVDSSTYTEVMYGKGVTIEVYEKNINTLYIADSYATEREADFNYTDAELDAYYNADRDEYDHYTYRSFFIRIDGEEPTDENKAEAKAKADAFASKVTDDASFAQLCREYCSEAEKTRYESIDASLSITAGEMIGGSYKEWLQDPARKSGDVTVSESNYGYYIVYFIERSGNDYNAADVEYFLMVPEMPVREDYETDEEYEAAVKERTDEVTGTAQSIYDDWSGGESFANVKAKYGGYLYESGDAIGISKAYFDNEVAEWVFADERKEDEVGLIITDTGEYYVVKYLGENDVYSRVYARKMMSGEDFNAWIDQSIEDADVSVKFFRILAK